MRKLQATSNKSCIHIFRLFVVFVVFITCFTTTTFAQRVRGVLIGGVNLSQIAGDECVGYKKFGFNGGVGGLMPMNKSETWLLGLEVLLSQKGAYENDYLAAYNAQLTYAEIPVLVHYEDKRGGFTFGAGFSYGRLVADPKEEYTYKRDDIQLVSTEDFSKNDFCALLDVRFKIWKQLKFNFRFAYSIIPTKTDVEYKKIISKGNENAWKRDFYNNSLTFRLLWVFNEKEPKQRKSRK